MFSWVPALLFLKSGKLISILVFLSRLALLIITRQLPYLLVSYVYAKIQWHNKDLVAKEEGGGEVVL